MDYVPVTSSTVAAIAYDLGSNTLGVRFLSGAEYHYYGVPEGVYQGFLSAPSVGQYLDQCVKKAGYSYVRVG
jgi:hypothetical protein